jgi:hypothetical protein
MEDTVYSRSPVLWVRSDKLQCLGSGDLQLHFRTGPEQFTTELAHHRPSPGTRRDRIQVNRCLSFWVGSYCLEGGRTVQRMDHMRPSTVWMARMWGLGCGSQWDSDVGTRISMGTNGRRLGRQQTTTGFASESI